MECGQHRWVVSYPDQTPVRVLIADDSLEFGSALCAVVAATPGFEVAGVEASGDALDVVISLVRPHLVLLEVHLGDSDGTRIARQLRRQHPDVVVVLLSASAPMPGTDPSLAVEDKRSVSPRWLADLWQRRGRSRPT